MPLGRFLAIGPLLICLVTRMTGIFQNGRQRKLSVWQFSATASKERYKYIRYRWWGAHVGMKGSGRIVEGKGFPPFYIMKIHAHASTYNFDMPQAINTCSQVTTWDQAAYRERH